MADIVDTGKYCPLCKQKFEESALSCPQDGAMLIHRDKRVGTVLDGKIELLDVLGQGGFGIVYKGKQAGFDRPVAVKIMKVLPDMDASAALRFRREAQLLSQLQHGNIASMYGFGVTQQGEAYLIYELVEGTRLTEVINRGRGRDVRLTIDIMQQLCAALSCLHKHGIVHRDIKPSNLMITEQPDGKPLLKLLDFGNAKLLPEYSSSHQKLTLTGAVFGSFAYMSPEQATGGKVDERSDIFAAGRILVELMQKGGPVPPQIAAIASKAMQESPDKRYQSTQEMSADLQAVDLAAADRDVAAGEAKANKPSSKAIIKYGVACFAVAIVAAAGFYLFTDEGQFRAAAAALATVERIAPNKSLQFARALADRYDRKSIANRFLRRQVLEQYRRLQQEDTPQWAADAVEYVRAEAAAGERDATSATAARLHNYLLERVSRHWQSNSTADREHVNHLFLTKLEVDSLSRGADSPEVFVDLKDVAGSFSAMGKREETIEYYRRAVDQFRNNRLVSDDDIAAAKAKLNEFEGQSPQTVWEGQTPAQRDLMELARQAYRKHDYAGAEALYQKLIAEMDKQIAEYSESRGTESGGDNPRQARIMAIAELGAILRDEKRWAANESLMKSLFESKQDLPLLGSSVYGSWVLQQLLDSLAQQHKDDQYQKWAERFTTSPEMHLQVVAWQSLATFHCRRGQEKEAQECFDRAAAFSARGNDGVDYLLMQGLLVKADCLTINKHPEAAQQICRDLLAHKRQDPIAIGAHTRLAKLYYQSHDRQQCLEHWREACRLTADTNSWINHLEFSEIENELDNLHAQKEIDQWHALLARMKTRPGW